MDIGWSRSAPFFPKVDARPFSHPPCYPNHIVLNRLRPITQCRSNNWSQASAVPVDSPLYCSQNEESGEFPAKTPKIAMAPEPNAMEQAVARAVRDNLERIKRTNEELTQAIGDVVAACSSSRPTNALPPMLRAQTAAAALTASMDVLSRFIAMALQSGPRSPLEESITQAIGIAAAEAPAAPQRPAPSVPVPQAAAPSVAAPSQLEPVEPPSYDLEPTPLPPSPVELEVPGFVGGIDSEFDINRLTPEEQELHRRANRVAKVSMQDIKMLRPDLVRLGREHRDICIRLKDDIEKAHREYDRRFKPIMDHPVDYFYRWLVEILADGDPSLLGEYPYATAGKSR